MSKDEFLSLLDRKLQVINEKERKDIIDEYRTHIEMKMQEGKSEEEAIEDFGNVDELVTEILDAYKINTNRVHNSFDNKFNRFMDELFDGFKRFLGSFTSLEVDDVVKFIFEIIIILVLLAVLHIPFSIVSSLGSSLLESLMGFGIGHVLARVWEIIISIVYVVIFIVVLVNLCTKRIQRYRNHVKHDSSTVFDDFKDSFHFDHAKENMHNFKNSKTKETTDQNYNEEDVTNQEKQEDDKEYQKETTENGTYAKRKKMHNDAYESEFGSGVSNVFSILMKIFFCLFIIPFIGIMIGLCCALGAMVVLSLEGLTLVGAYFIIIGGIMVTSAFISLLYSALWKRGY